jgi:predicted nucleic acid-binding Zn ribbon protein
MWRRSDRRCTQCQHIEEYWTASIDAVVECSKCGGPTERKLSPISTKFEGVGWPDADDKWARNHERAAKMTSP